MAGWVGLNPTLQVNEEVNGHDIRPGLALPDRAYGTRMSGVWLAYGRRMHKMSMMARPKPKRLPLPVRRNMNLTDAAQDRWRKLNDS